MISLEQIKTLDDKVKQAVSVIDDLRGENSRLKQKLNSYQSRIEELERLIGDFKRDQGAIEQGILDAIDQLDKLEHAPPPPEVSQPMETAPEPEPDIPAAEEPVPPEEDTPRQDDVPGPGPADTVSNTGEAEEIETGEKPGFYSEEEDSEGQEPNELDIF
jgi:FtsZ-binding cell division protein ZapB